ncbi:phosphoesterase [Thermoplasmatales archaeon SW_10_69_26]|nr:MAG: phosphoesterase [Thermoplasmatales archaeon SW_10_69_26]
MSERPIDLQTHSVHSDGTLTPTEIVERAAETDLAAVALTDHDTTSGLEAFEQAGEDRDVETVPGVELSARVGRQDVDILGYFVDPDDETLQEVMEKARRFRRERAPEMIERLAEVGAPIEIEAVEEHAGEAAIGRPHIAQALVDAGHVDDVDEAFAELIGEEQPGCVPKERLDPPEAIGAIHSAHGVAVLAHPSHIHPAAFGRILEVLFEAGVDGIEVWHSDHDRNHEQFFGQQAAKHGLVKTGGSDFHGDNKPDIALGEGRGDLGVPYESLERLRQRAGSE